MTKGLLLGAGCDEYFKLDPRTKLLLMALINMSAFGGDSITCMLMMTVIPCFLLSASGQIKPGFYCAFGYIAAVLGNEFLVPVTHGIVNMMVVMVSGMLYRLMPGLIMGYYLVATTTVSEFVASMERMHVSEKIVIPMSVMFRFFPTIGEEARAIGDAMRMRGIGWGGGGFLKNPLAMLEYRFVPLLISTVKIGEELSAASLTRGLGAPVRRTNICQIGFGVRDIGLAVLAVVAFIGLIFL
jgi:energy-coupling factor transporter transmembrane protein EcfT